MRKQTKPYINPYMNRYVSQAEFLELTDKLKSVEENCIESTVDLSDYATIAYVDEKVVEAVSGGSVSLDGYATKEYVDEQISAIPETDLSDYYTKDQVGELITEVEGKIPSIEGLATESYVDEKVAEASNIDLSAYATSEYVDSEISAVKESIPSLEGLATESYVDEKVAAIEIPSIEGLATSEEVAAVEAKVDTAVKYTDVATTENPDRQAIVLKNHDLILGTTTSGDTYNLAMISKWDVADFGSSKVKLNLNGSEERPTYNDDKEIALVDDIPSIEGLASENYVDAKIAEAQLAGSDSEIDLSAYATTGYVDEKINSIEIPSIEGLASEAYVDEKVASIEIPETDLSDYYTKNEVDSAVSAKTTQTIAGSNGTSYVWNESSGGGARFVHNDGTESFMGVNDGGENGMVAQVYADKALSGGGYEGTVLNIYKKGIFYHNNRVTTDADYSADDANRELAVKGDIPSIEGLASESYVDEKVAAIEVPSVEGLASETYVDEKVASIEIPSVEGLASETYVDEKIASIEHPTVDLSDYYTKSEVDSAVDAKTTTAISSSTGTAYVWNETSGGGARYVNVDGTASFVGVNNGGADDITAQIYSKDNSTNFGTRLNVYNKGIFYVPNKSTSDADYVADDANQELAVKGDIPSLEGYATEAFVTEKVAEAQLAGSEVDLSAYATKTELQEVADSIPSLDNYATTAYVDEKIGEIEHPTVDLSSYATTESVDEKVAEVEAKIPTNYVTQSISSSTGTAYVWNETSGGGARYDHVDGSRSFVGVNNGGADDIAVQIYAKNNSTNVGTRINVYNKGAYYIPDMSNTDSAYEADGEKYEIAVKGDIPSLEGYATESYVDTKIAEAELSGSEVDLSAYATKSEVEAVEASIPSVEGLASETYVDEKVSALESDVASKYVLTDIVGPNGTSTIYQHMYGGGPMFKDNEGTTSYVGVNDGINANGITGQMYSHDGTNVTRMNLFTKGIFYHGGRTFSDADYVADDPDYEVAVKKDIPSIEGLASENYVDAKIAEAELSGGEVDLSAYATTEYVDNVVATVDSKIPTNYVVQSIASDTGTAYVWNERTGGGARYENVDGTTSFVGVNYGGADDITAQIYSKNASTNFGTRLNVYSKGIYYVPNKSTSDADYVADGADYELAVKGDLADFVTESLLTEAVTDVVKYVDISTEENPDRKSIVLENHDMLLGRATDGEAYNLAMVSKWDVADFGTTKLHLNLNGLNERPTYNDDYGIALVSDIETTKTELEAEISAKTIATITSDTGSSIMQNEESGCGPKYWHVDGTRSYVGVNNGGADGITAQIYSRDNTTDVGTRINIYSKGAFYIPNMSRSDENYEADGAQYEIAVKGDLEAIKTEYESRIAALETQIAALQEVINNL